MKLSVDAACGCVTGRVRKNNEDNLFFQDMCLDADNNGMREYALFSGKCKRGLAFAVFDGMGGENFGEVASFAAASGMVNARRSLADWFSPEEKYLDKLTKKLNDAVVAAKRELQTERCGTTMVALSFTPEEVYVCNVGDSRAYRLRGKKLTQLSVDHVEKRMATSRKKAPLTQHLGIDPEDLQIEPYIAKDELRKGDVYLICSDGITDMLTDQEITEIMRRYKKPRNCAHTLIMTAMEHGGRDNATAIVCRVV